VEYSKTKLGVSCAEAVDGLVNWAMENIDRVEDAISGYDTRENDL